VWWLLGAAGVGAYIGRQTVKERPGDLWLLAAFAAGVFLAATLTKQD
jgi:hypothetical protein